MSRLFAIGDIHGCHEMLQTLLIAIAPNPNDTIVILGDFIDRGTGSKQVMDIMMYYQKFCNMVVLMGNHEEMMLQSLKDKECLKFWLKFGGVETLASFGLTADLHGLLKVPLRYFQFLKETVAYYETADFIFTHATPIADLPMEKQTAEGLRWRFLSKQPYQHQSGKTVICGHSTQKNGQVLQQRKLLCIDTYAYGGVCLTALQLDNMLVWQVLPSLKINQIKLAND